MKVKDLIIHTNGSQVMFDENGEQYYPAAPYKSWLQLLLEDLDSKGVDPIAINCIIMLVNGRERRVTPFRTTDGEWNYRFEDL